MNLLDIKQNNDFQLGYCYLLEPTKLFMYHKQEIFGLSFDLLFKIYDIKGNELYFSEELLGEQAFNFNGKIIKISDIISLRVTEDGRFSYERNEDYFEDLKDFVIDFEVQNMYKILYIPNTERPLERSSDNIQIPINCSEFMDILKDNLKLFKTSINIEIEPINNFYL